ncbi:MAG TPA: DUF4097 family beta strand repeat-containing protein [bacterium]|nr:DUF4097 family beta strand repeat-containing protein [bacterium]HQG44963.1 DUF4097 family beta strand repeat-containing protein [bacterium]HQI47081.1 DUF4097 family beta strand repeat-containing protein [bacterium]HQJ65362.1 DUF4097 family beta strand repeat-containing protein [bacterium]
MNSKGFNTLIAVFTCIGLAVAAQARADIERTVQKNFPVSPGGWLYIDADLGTIEVTGGTGNQVELTLLETIDAPTDKAAENILKDLHLDFTATGNEVRVSARYDRDRFFKWGNRRLKLRFTVTLPRAFNVNLKTAGGSISVAELEGEVISKTSGGSLSFGKIIGPVKGNTSGGSITLESCKGKADVATSGGSISIGRVDGDVLAATSGGSIRIESAKGRVQASTSGGGITVEEVAGEIDASTSGGSISAHITRQPAAPCRLATSGGSVNVSLAPGIKVDLNASTSGGRVRSEVDVLVKGEFGHTALRGQINGGGPELYLRTSGGNITISKAVI